MVHLVVILACLCVIPTSLAISEAHKKESIDKHNDLRRQLALHGDTKGNQPPAADMTKVTWDHIEGTPAQVWAQSCSIGHDRSGQNWAGGYSSPASLIQLWYNEVVDYNYESHTCALGKVCGHYTQLVWAKSVGVGCGVTDCSISLIEFPTVLVCNYREMGNLAGHRPYKAGKACSLCPAELPFCDDGLCVAKSDPDCAGGKCDCRVECQNGGILNADTCQCQCKNGYHGNACEMECVDSYEWCTYSSVKESCDTYKSYCEISCGVCMHNCDKKCENGGVLDTQTCTCSCPDHISGDRCETCSLTCENGGRVNSDCKCDCPDNFEGDRCENACTDSADWCTWDSVKSDCDQYGSYCKLSCNSCVYAKNSEPAAEEIPVESKPEAKPAADSNQECMTYSDGSYYYTGSKTTTVNGVTCQRWDTDSPHTPAGRYENFDTPENMSNYCRNPVETDDKPWCYTTDPSVRWDYCGIPEC